MIGPEGPYAKREGLVTLGVLPQHDAQEAILRSVPRISEAMRLRDAVVAHMGDRLVPDVMAGEGNSLLFLRDADVPDFVIAEPLLMLDANVPEPPPLPMVPLELPEHLRSTEAAAPLPERPRILPGPHRFPGRLKIAEGPAYVQITYGDDGTKKETVQTAGDLWTWGYHHADRPFAIDPFAKPAQPPPIGLYCRDDLDPDGHDIDTLAGMVAELDPARLVSGRVYVPVPTPGGANGCWARGLWRLREALWDGRIGEDESGWVVIDAWTGSVVVVRPTLAEAFGAWKEAVRTTQPLPPREPTPTPPVDVPDEAPSSEYDAEKKTARISTGTVHLVFVPRVRLDWPDPRPENVPAIAVPLAPPAPVPAGWEGYGFTRRLRLVGEHGDVCTAFVRDEGDDAFTLIGEGAIGALDPATLDVELDRIDDDRRRDFEATWLLPGRPNPYTNPEYPWVSPGYRVWDDLGRTPRLREGGIGWTSEMAVRDLGADHLRWTIKRMRRSTAGPIAANRNVFPPDEG